MVIFAFMLGNVFGGALWHFGGVYTEAKFGSLQRFSSYMELKSFLNASSKGASYTPYFEGFATLGAMAVFDSAKASDYSATNIQVAGVDEADIVKTDGEYIYLVSDKTVFILRAYPPEEAKILCKLALSKTIAGIYVSGDKLIIFQGGYGSDAMGIFRSYYAYEAATSMLVYDVSNRAAPTLSRNVTLNGGYLNSRMIGDYVYLIVSKYAALRNGEVELPTIYYDNHIVKTPASSIYYVNASDNYHAFTTIITLNVQGTQEPRYETLLLGATSNIYVSQRNIYITAQSRDDTKIHKIGVQGGEITYVAGGNVTGRVLNQFSMDEYNGYFRVATTKGYASPNGASSRSSIYILDENMNLAGKLEGLAPGEDIHSARFMGDRCYLVTFKKIDPLFVIDLKNPGSPQVLGKLKIPGYSDYLHPYDENHLIGVGKETAEAVGGDFAWYQGVKLSLFDVTNVSAPKEMAKIEIGDRGTDSPVLRDHKAFLFSKSNGMLVLPILLAEIDEQKYPQGIPSNAYGEYTWQGAYVLDVSLKGGFAIRGRITHLNGTDLARSGHYLSSPYFVKRTLYIENVLYTVSDRMVKLSSLETLTEIKTVNLP